MTDEPTIIDRLDNAKVGDVVWVFDSQQRRLDANGKYEGRGVWNKTTIIGETRASFITGGQSRATEKFDRKTGRGRAVRGYMSHQMIAGDQDKEDYIWRQEHRYKLSEYVRSLDNTTVLKQIAALVGYQT